MTEQQLREQLVEIGASLFDRGFSVGSAGNLSVRTRDGFLMTPTNSSLGRLTADSLAELDHGWNHVGGPRPSKEVVMHRALYEVRPEAQAVVHLHSTYVTAVSCLAEEGPVIPALTPYFVMRVGREVPMVPYFRPGSAEVDVELRAAARQGPAVVLANHGSIVAGESLEAASNAAEELEVSAQLAFLVRDRSVRPLTEAQIQELLD
ncbi:MULTISPECIES: aldolase [Nesterenkonia]|uniref:3-oxo-tetronate 4-phosphate decarboxylase n=1 Tax=Nesterenkonia xinjiangensis TaxID=225327 RepID=A0A7Z0GM43_9MICC|nr:MULTISPECIES: aldolase [Nesterenkonia]MDZ5077560.1 aldolase [Nesterenkonia sp. HG001]NYJ78510.1 ribulose-5-phosphate 4-epimerase/fuculose-1-phosphate aldolase [Nesterenkonia xinjiangensis]